MADCTGASNYLGKEVILAYVESCGDIDPTTLTYLPLGAVNQKDVNIGTTTTDITSDSTQGIQASLVTFLTFSATVAGFATSSDSIASNQASLKKYLVNEVIDGRQPSAFVRIIYPDVTYYAFCNVTSSANSSASTDATTFNFEFTATATPIGSGIKALQVLDTVAA